MKLIPTSSPARLLKPSGHISSTKQALPSQNTQKHTVSHKSSKEESAIKEKEFLPETLTLKIQSHPDRK